MQLRNLRVSNFGLYAGHHDFNLAPHIGGGQHRPLTVFVGHNGSGKSTLFTALSVALHGPLALGERVGQAQYNEFLFSRMHRHKGEANNAVSQEAGVALSLEVVQSGVPRRVHIERRWRRRGRIIDETLSVSLDGQAVLEADSQAWINDLLSPGIARLCFFDAENLNGLAGTDGRNPQLAETLQRLLGLDLIQRLQADLRAYMMRQGGTGAIDDWRKTVHAHQQSLDVLSRKLAQLQAQADKLSNREAALKVQIADQERRIAAAGGLYAARRAAQQVRQEGIGKEIEATKAQIADLAAHLLPFTLAPHLSARLSKRLTLEAESQRRQVAQSIVDERLRQVAASVAEVTFWEGLKIGQVKQQALRERLTALLQPTPPSGEETPILHHLADPERDQIQGWIRQVLETVPAQAGETGDRLRHLQSETREIELDLHRAPEDAELAPLHEELMGLQAELAALQQEKTALDQQIGGLAYQRNDKDRQLQRADEKLTEAQGTAQEMLLAQSSRSALRAYEDALTHRRLAELEQALVGCFNTLCQKEHLLASVSIDPDEFAISLESADGRALSLGSFSAGERQLYALALLQALRQVSRRPLPLLIDTPLARLDEQHRQRLLHDYLPVASDQILLFATDAEADAAFFAEAEPYLAQAYCLRFDPTHGATQPQEIRQIADLLSKVQGNPETADAL